MMNYDLRAGAGTADLLVRGEAQTRSTPAQFMPSSDRATTALAGKYRRYRAYRSATFPIRGRRQRDHPEDARADALGQRDRAALAAPSRLEHDDDAQAPFDPFLEVAQPDLQLPQFFSYFSRFIASFVAGRPIPCSALPGCRTSAT
jgi:hypothetical protein